ncbi:MAG: lipoprotein signal peptidase [Bacteroidota bacterium]
MKKPLLLILAILLVDQLVKFWVKTHMYLGEEIRFTDWAIIHFTENNGMAFGMEFGGDYGKIFLTSFRILFVIAIFFYLHKLIKEKASQLYIYCIAMVIAGAAGNIFDSVFYGKIFNGSEFQIASFMPTQGYASWLHGRVVDMFYFPIINGHFPTWFPIWGGDEFVFFRPVFNVADASISISVILMILFQKRIFGNEGMVVVTENDEAIAEGQAQNSENN